MEKSLRSGGLEGKLLLRVEEAAQLVGISRSHAFNLLNRGEWPTVCMGESRRVPRAWLEAWVQEQVVRWQQAGGRTGG